jgi:hypothetical protein
MNKLMMTAQVWNDAGLLREYIAVRHGATLTFGGCSFDQFTRARKHCRRLASLIGSSIDAVMDSARADYELIAE